MLLSLSSCIKDEMPNIEVDIIEVLSPQEGILNVVYKSTSVEIYIDPAKIDPKNVTFDYRISDGATILPAPESVNDYSLPQSFLVTSEDGEWSKTYMVRIIFQDLPTAFDFENWYQPEGERYKIPVDIDKETGDSLFVWSCGNEPYAFITNKYDDYTKFPTQPTTEAAQGNCAVKLETKLTGDYYKPIAAGNLFIGQFDSSQYDPLKSTQFGLPFMKKPLRITGKYKYRSGGLTYFTQSPDSCRIQAILYKTDSQVKYLDGYTIKTSPNIVARAEMVDEGADTPGDGYQDFDFDFVYSQEIDRDILESGGYNLAIIFSASRRGDTYDGARGSVLLVDDVKIICDTNF